MKVAQLIREVEGVQEWGSISSTIEQIDFDSRHVKAGSMFVAVKGTQTDGHQYIDKAIESGALVIIAEQSPSEAQVARVDYWLKVADSSMALGQLAAAFYGYPDRHLTLVGVTGTNGKTTAATLLYQLFSELGYKVGLLSTVENRIGQVVIEASHTTPDAVQINKLLAEMEAAACSYVFMEVSSHAVDQNRIAGLQFNGAVFTNISHDHLDYHGSFKAYINAKKKFFDGLPKSAFALVNADDKRGAVMVQNTRAKSYDYSARSMAGFKVRIIENAPQGLHIEIDNHEVYTRLIGHFNAYNLVSVYATAVLLEQDKEEVLRILSGLKGPAGRVSYVEDDTRGVLAVVDYAHTPDAIEKICSTLSDMLGQDARLLTVVGCGGDRDKAKRPLMAKAACEYSHEVIFTSDNPRSEDPEIIINDMMEGLTTGQQQQVLRIANRRSAIATACKLAKRGDIVLVAGKGHENYQEINGVKQPFNDTAVLQELFSA